MSFRKFTTVAVAIDCDLCDKSCDVYVHADSIYELIIQKGWISNTSKTRHCCHECATKLLDRQLDIAFGKNV